MKKDLFDSLDKAGFGSNVHEVAADGECRVLRLDDDTGEGFMTMYRVFDGVYIMFNDFHLRRCVSKYHSAEPVLCIDHCREGRVELPLSHYHGISIGFVQDTAQLSLSREMPLPDIDISELAKKLCRNNKEFIIRTNETLNLLPEFPPLPECTGFLQQCLPGFKAGRQADTA